MERGGGAWTCGKTSRKILYLVYSSNCTKNASKITENTAEKSRKKRLTRAVPCDTINFALTQKAWLQTCLKPYTNKGFTQEWTLKTEQWNNLEILRSFWQQKRTLNNVNFRIQRLFKEASVAWEDKLLTRVWSWLRMNAGGVLNTCKSNGVLMWARGSLLLINLFKT